MANIAVLGYGTVGSGVVEVLNTNKDRINSKSYEPINIKYVLDLRDFPGDPVQEIIQLNIHDSLGMYRHRAKFCATLSAFVDLVVHHAHTTHLLAASTRHSAAFSSKIAASTNSGSQFSK